MTPTSSNQGGLLDLAARCEAATGPDRELEIAIVEALGWKRKGGFWNGVYWERGGERIWLAHIPAVTASLDAAMTLVPEGRGLIYKRHGIKNVWRVQILSGDGDTFVDGDAATPALALTAAALKAKASSHE